MKKKLLLAAVLVIAVSILAAGTAAFYSNRVTTHNVITSGGIKIQLVETMLEGTKEVPYKNPDTQVPGQTVSKIVRVKNLEKDAFVRVKVELEVKNGKETLKVENLKVDYDTVNWQLKDGWYYYRKAVPAGVSTEPLFREVSLNGASMGNEYKGATVTLVVKAEAVQCANNGTDPVKASGWGN